MPTWAPLPDFQVSSDAAGSLGYGAIFQSHWFSGAWSAEQRLLSIAYKELFPIVVAAFLWGPQWVSRQVKFLCDNESVVAVLKSGTSRDKSLMVLLRYLTMLAIRHSFSFTASSVPGKDNPVADALSQFQFQQFKRLVPHADATPSPFLPPFWQRFRCLDSEVSVPSYPRSCPFHQTSVPHSPTSICQFLPSGRSC